LFPEEELKKAVKEVRIDTTVQEKSITFPTDRKLYDKVIQYCVRIADKEGVKQKRKYPREIRKIKNALRFSHHPRNHKKKKKLETQFLVIAMKFYNVLLDQALDKTDKWDDTLFLMYDVLTQQWKINERYTVSLSQMFIILLRVRSQEV
jgi:transposase, IS5 family